ncbi:MAG TPA: hypothetical protein VMV91_03025 [Rhodocyclaceae bacterium]|nr:hypothetical protein [Rhodocyclaceae bacterium]
MSDTKDTQQTSFIVTPGSAQSAQQIFMDGVSGVMLGGAVSKIQFHVVVGHDTDTKAELRQVTLSITMPTVSLVDFCNQTLKAVSENSHLLKNLLDEAQTKIFATPPKHSGSRSRTSKSVKK